MIDLVTEASRTEVLVVQQLEGEEGARGTWWSRRTGEVGERVSLPQQPVLTMAPDGAVYGVVADQLVKWAPGEVESMPIGAVGAAEVSSLSLSISGELLLADGDPLTVLDLSAKEVWTAPEGRATMAGWLGDRVIYAPERTVYEVKPTKGERVEVGVLPDPEGGRWLQAPGGPLMLVHAKEISLLPPPHLLKDRAKAGEDIQLAEEGMSIRWIDPDRWVALSSTTGIYLYDHNRSIPLGADLAGIEDEGLLWRLLPAGLLAELPPPTPPDGQRPHAPSGRRPGAGPSPEGGPPQQGQGQPPPQGQPAPGAPPPGGQPPQ